MKKIDFFKDVITDNNYDGIPLTSITEMSKSDKKNPDRIFTEIREIEARISTKDLREIATLIKFGEEFDANTDQRIFELKGNNFENARIYTFNIVGTIYYQKKQFNINSRFGDDFLQYMIASSSGFLELENSGGFSSETSIAEWLMIYFFKVKLKEAFALGVYKTYSAKQDDLSTIKGSIDINNLIKKNYFDGKIRCNYKEHSYSNEINYVISLALDKLFSYSQYLKIIEDIHIIKNAFKQIEYPKQNIKFLKNYKVKNPYYLKYNEVFQLAYNILNNDFGATGEEDFSSFLFDISLLFEHHIRKLLQRKFRLFNKNKKEFTIPNGIFYNDIYPDVIIDHGDNKISIFDIKYKHFNRVKGVNRDDQLQLTTYVATHLSIYDVIECGFIYPKLEKTQYENITEQTLHITGKEIPFKIIFYNIVDKTTLKQNGEDKSRFDVFKENQKNKDEMFCNDFIQEGNI